MATVTRTPWCGTFTLTTAATAYRLSDLLAAATNPPRVPANGPMRAQFLTIQADVNAGGARFYVGNSDVSSTNKGWELVATQVLPIYSMDSNLISLNDIYITSNTNSVKINVSFITR